MVQPQNLSFFLLFLVVLRGTAAPVLFQWLVSRDVSTGAPFSNGTIIPISTSLLLVSVLIHSTRAAPAGLFFMRSPLPLAAPYIVVSSIRPLSPNIGRSSYKKAALFVQSLVKDLLDSIVPRKRCLKIGRGPCFLLSVLGRLALFHFITIKFMGDFSYLESFRGVLCSFPFRTFFFHRYNSRYDRHKQIILFLFHKRRRNIISSLRNNFITWRCFLVYCGPHESAEEGRRAGLLRSAERRPSRLIHVMKISHGGVCIFIMGVILSNARKIQFTGKTPLGSELHIGGSVRSTSRGIDQLHGPTFHPICGNLIIYNTKSFTTKLMSDRSCRGLIPQWPTDGVPARSGMGSRIIQQASSFSKKRISFADSATSGKGKEVEHNSCFNFVSKKLTMFPEKRFYFSDQETSITKVAIDTNPFTDLYALIGTGSFETGWYTTVIKLPSIFRIWIGFIMASLGGLLSPFRKLTLYQQRLDWD
nr:cytochrome c biogenesis factor C [Pellia neesiana]